jgi:hypothetical protein
MSDNVYGTLTCVRGLAPAEDRHDVDVDVVELGGQAAVTVVEADHEQAAVGEHLAEGVRPRRHLSGEAHHEEQRGSSGEPVVSYSSCMPVETERWAWAETTFAP